MNDETKKFKTFVINENYKKTFDNFVLTIKRIPLPVQIMNTGNGTNSNYSICLKKVSFQF